MRPKTSVMLIGTGMLLGLVVVWSPLGATEFYRGRTVEILVHAPPGGSYDLRARLLARHLPKHLPGSPAVVVKNMPGGGGLIQANYLFARGKPDGTTIGLLGSGVAQMEALGMPGVRYESNRFRYVGLIADTAYIVVSRRNAPVRTLDELLDPNKPVLIVGASAPPSILYVIPAMLNLVFEKVVGRPVFNIVTGYAGQAPLNSALERGEIDGFGTFWETLPATAPHFLEPVPGKGFIHLLGYGALVRDRELEELRVPFIPDRVKDPSDRALLDFLGSFFRVPYAVAAPPGMPADRLKTLREAFMKTMSDPDYVAGNRKVNFEVRPLPGEDVEKIIKAVMQTPRETIQIARELFQK